MSVKIEWTEKKKKVFEIRQSSLNKQFSESLPEEVIQKTSGDGVFLTNEKKQITVISFTVM